ncbi:hypothetical protein D3C83_313310 [compost metagenome]
MNVAVIVPEPVAEGAEKVLDPTPLKLTELSALFDARLAFAAPSCAAPAGMLATTVPFDVIPLTATV